MTRDEALAWAKERAREYAQRGEFRDAIASMLSDLSKHPELERVATNVGTFLALALFAGERPPSKEEVIRWIDGFN